MPVDQQPRTLAEAHELLTHLRPAHDAAPLVWVAFHRRAAEVYVSTAKVDLRHQQEAQHWAGPELRQAREIEDHIVDESSADMEGR